MQHFSRAILKKITTLFGTSVPPALPNDHENTSKASRAFTLRPHLSAMRLGADVQLAFVRVDSAKDRERPRSTGDSEENHNFIWHLGPSYVAQRNGELRSL